MIESAATWEGVGGWAGRAVQVWLGEVLPLLFRALANYAAEAPVTYISLSVRSIVAGR